MEIIKVERKCELNRLLSVTFKKRFLFFKQSIKRDVYLHHLKHVGTTSRFADTGKELNDDLQIVLVCITKYMDSKNMNEFIVNE